VRYTPEAAGDHRLRIVAHAADGREAVAHESFKVTRGVTPYRFTNHHHYMIAWGPSSLAGVAASARRWSVDAVFLGSGQFYHCKAMVRRTSPALLAAVDSPLTRIFPGQEVHPHHPYGLDEGAANLDADVRHHGTTMGCHTITPADWDYWDPSTLRKAHARGGLVVVAHHQRGDKWWLRKQQGHCFDAVSFDHVEGAYWDNILRKGLLPGIRGTDSGFGPLGNVASTVWMREAFNLPNLLKACINGRVTFVDLDTARLASKDSYIWFDINNELVGGTLYAVDTIRLHLKIDAHQPMQTIRLVKFGDKGYKTLRATGNRFEHWIEERAEDFTYYRVEAHADKRTGPDKGVNGFAAAVTNPIYVRRVNGPRGAYFYFDKDARIYLDRKAGRFLPKTARVIETGYRGGIWRIVVQEPDDRGRIAIGGVAVKGLALDGGASRGARNAQGEIVATYGRGRHTIELQC
ncbi:MAG: hypothetical protein WCP21_14825, partial [Armatimonadota bacterium]